jgi:hypothetical protein
MSTNNIPTFTDNENPEPRNLTPVFIIGIVAFFVALCIIATVIVTHIMKSNQSDGVDNLPQNSSTVAVDPPTIKSVTASVEGKNIKIHVSLSDFDSTQWGVNYELSDQNRQSLNTGTIRRTDFNFTTDKAANDYRLKVRLQSLDTPDNPVYSSWSESKDFTIDGVSGESDKKINDAFYQTPWALKNENATEQDLEHAIEVGFGAKRTERIYECMPLNSGKVTLGEVLAPVPNVTPKRISLSYIITQWEPSTKTGLIQYAWC